MYTLYGESGRNHCQTPLVVADPTQEQKIRHAGFQRISPKTKDHWPILLKLPASGDIYLICVASFS